MKKTKVLVPALGILCLSMAASVTGTVAWFSTNATVNASGMAIKAVTASNLFIHNSSISGGIFGTAPTESMMYGQGNAGKIVEDITDTHESTSTATTALKPASTSTSAWDNWFFVAKQENIKTGGEVFSDATWSDGTFSTAAVASKNYGALASYVNVGKFYLYLQDSEARGITATVDITPSNDDNKALLNCVRFALVFTTVDGATSANESGLSQAIWSGSSEDGRDWLPMTAVNTLGSAVTAHNSGKSVTIGTMKENTVVHVYSFMWIEGQDDECVNEASLHSADYSVDIQFDVAQ